MKKLKIYQKDFLALIEPCGVGGENKSAYRR